MDRKLLKRSIGLIMLKFGSHKSNTRLVELLYISTETWPRITTVNKF